MAKGNAFVGMLRGSIGDVTFQRLKGAQISKARNRQPANPRSQAQQYQRARFLEPSKFYAKGVQNLFKFAYEDKRAHESEFNAFMRHNSKLGMMLKKYQNDDPAIAKFGKFILSFGSLGNDYVEAAGVELVSGFGTVPSLVMNTPTEMTEFASIADLSRYFLGINYRLQEGDIITLLFIGCNNVVSEEPDYIYAEGSNTPIWKIIQFRVDSADENPIPADLGYIINDGKVSFFSKTALAVEEMGAAGVVYSRVTEYGLQVSTSTLHLNAFATDAYNLTKAKANIKDEWMQEVIRSYGAGDEAILKGSLSAEAVRVRAIITGATFAGQAIGGGATIDEAGILVLSGTDISSNNVRLYMDEVPFVPVQQTDESISWNIQTAGTITIYVNGSLFMTLTSTAEPTIEFTSIKIGDRSTTTTAQNNLTMTAGASQSIVVEGENLSGQSFSVSGSGYSISNPQVTATRATCTLVVPNSPLASFSLSFAGRVIASGKTPSGGNEDLPPGS